MDLIATPENPLPPGATAVTVTTRDGLTLRGLVALGEQPRGTVVVIGGRGDFMERYFETMREIMARGYAVAAVDVRGQGGSPRPLANRLRCHVNDFAEFDEDLRAFMTQVVMVQCPGPHFALAHSTGGNILLRTLHKEGWFQRAVVVSPLIGLLYGFWPLPIVHVLVFLATRLGLGWLYLPGQNRKPLGRKDYPSNPLTADARRWNRDSGILEVEPRLGVGGPTFSWLRAAMRSTAKLKALGPRDRLKAPVLIVAAGLDRVVDNAAIRRFARRVPGVALVFVPGARHEILAEGDAIRQQFFAAFDAFLAAEDGG